MVCGCKGHDKIGTKDYERGGLKMSDLIARGIAKKVERQVNVVSSIKVFVENFPLVIPEVNDSARIQRAINSIKDIGGTVFTSDSASKTFICEGLLLSGTKPITLEGNATLKLPNGATQHLLSIDDVSNHRISGIKLDGNKANVTENVNGIHFIDYAGSTSSWRPAAYMHKVTVTDFTGIGVYIGKTRCGGTLFDCTITKCSYGIKSPDTTAVADWVMEDNELGDNDYGLYGHFPALLFSNNAVYRSKYTNVYLGAQTWYAWIENNSIDTSKQIGLFIQGNTLKSNMIMVVENSFFGNSTEGNGLYSDIVVSGLNNALIGQNTFFWYDGAVKTKYALEFTGAGNRQVTFQGNILDPANFANGVVSDVTKISGYTRGVDYQVRDITKFFENVTFDKRFSSSPATSTELLYQSVTDGEGYARVQLYQSGKLAFGDGTANPDTNIYRTIGGVLQSDNPFKAKRFVVSEQIAAASVANGTMFEDTDGKLKYKNLAGTVTDLTL